MVISKKDDLLYRLHLDPVLLSAAVILCVLGLMVLYSAVGQETAPVMRQGIKMAAGFVVMMIMAQIAPGHLLRWAPWLYGVGLGLLISVMFLGTGRGAQRWLDLGVMRFQPSEVMKLCVPLVLAWYLSDKGAPPSLTAVFCGVTLVMIPVLIIAEQPDLGTALLVAAAGLSVLFFAGVRWRLLAIAAIAVVVSAPLLWHLLHDYQRQRLLTLLDPERDPLGSGYHILQSMIAVGSGGLYGKGWLNGTQSHLEFLPERSTDFIFAVVCEEIGLMGVLVLMALYVLVIVRGLNVAVEAQGTFGRLVAAAVTVTLFIYVFVNMGMVIGQLPVVGVPLPFISYGGTSIVTLMASFGILMSIHTHKRMMSS